MIGVASARRPHRLRVGWALGAAALVSATLACFPSMRASDYVTGVVLLEGESARALTEGRPVPELSDGNVELQYLGVGGWRIETPRTVLLTGPLFTRPEQQ